MLRWTPLEASYVQSGEKFENVSCKLNLSYVTETSIPTH